MSNGVGVNGNAGRVERAVKREMRKQTWLSVLFTVLLIVPLGLAGFYFVFGHTDRQMVQAEVRQEVEQRVEPVARLAREAAPALAKVNETAAAVQQQQAAALLQLQRVDGVLQEQEQVRLQVSQLTQQLPQIQASLVQAQELGSRMAELRDAVDAHNRRLVSMAEAQTRILQDQQALSVSVRDVSAKVDRVPLERLELLDRRVERLSVEIDKATRAAAPAKVPR